MPVSLWTVFLFALLTAVATGAGALPFLFTKRMSERWVGLSNAMAGGLMVAASMMLIYEGSVLHTGRMLGGVALGALFMIATRWVLNRTDDVHLGALKQADARKALLIIGVMTLHSFTEGVGVGVSFGGGQQLGVFITLAIAVHNIPEGLAISLVLVPRGEPVWKAALWSIFSSLPQPLMAVPAYLFVEAFAPVLPVGLGFAAGAMLWMVASELIPDALETASARAVTVASTLSLVAMLLFQFFLKG